VPGPPPLPADFLFGVATADHQCEAYESRWEDVRDRFDRAMKLTERGRATDFWTRYPEDVELARGLGCTAFRFSIAWARVEPEPGTFDAGVLDHYSQMVDAIRTAGMQPVVTLHHYTWPLHVEQRGGMTAPDFPAWFERYAQVVGKRLGSRVEYWITFNEPTELVYGYLKLWWDGEYRMPPGADAGTDLGVLKRLIRNLFVANAAARRALRAINPQARVSANALILGLPSWLQRFLDWRTKRLRAEGAWESAIGRLQRRPIGSLGGSVDLVISAMTVTPERGRQVDFSHVYEVGSLALLVDAGSALTDMGEVRRVAAAAGSTAESSAPQVLPNATLVAFPSTESAAAAVAGRQADAVLGDRLVLDQVIRSAPTRFRLLVRDLLPQRYAVAVRKNATDLLALVNRVIDGGPDGARPEGPTVAGIRSRRHLRVGVRGGVEGVSLRDASGQWSGSEIDLGRSIAAAIFGDPGRVRFHVVGLRERITALSPLARLTDPLLQWLDMLLGANNGNWWHLGIKGELPKWLCPAGCEGQQDFVGLDYYWGISGGIHRLARLSNAAQGKFDQAPVWPGGLKRVLAYVHRLFPDQQILVVENGCVTSADGVDRNEYLRRHLREVQVSVANGIPVCGYICWSLTTNREWGLAFSPGNDFGLYRIDLDRDPRLVRTRTSSADIFAAIVADRSVR